MPTTVEIPTAVSEAVAEGLGAAGLGAAAFPRWALEAVVLSAVGENLLTTEAAADALGLGYHETLALLKRRGVPLDLSDEDRARDREDLLKAFPDLASR